MPTAKPAPSSFNAWHYLLATTPFVVIFLIMPCELFFNQTEEWELRPGQLALLPLVGALGLLVTWLALALLAGLRPWLARGAAVLLFVVGCYLLLADLYAPVQMEAIDGGALASDEPLNYTLLEMAIGLISLIILGLLWRGMGKRISLLFAGLLAFVGLGYGALVLVNLLTPEPVIARAEAGIKAGTGNVYHIVLDRMQTDAFLDAVHRASARPTFKGFELYRNNVSNYLTTIPSRASYMTGTFYHEGEFKDWHRHVWRRQGIQKLLADQGYRVWNYVPYRQWQDPAVDVFRYTIDIYQDRTGIPASGFADFVMLWLLRPVPNFLTNEALAPVEAARDLFLAVLEGFAEASPAAGDRPKRLTMTQGIQVVASKQMFDQLVDDEDKRAAAGEYVHLHAILPHVPYVYDSTCTYRDPSAAKRDHAEHRRAYLDQATCTVRLIDTFLARLKALDRYDDATILIHADTGAEEGFMADPPDYRSAKMTLGRPDDRLLSGINALLMIKRPHEVAPLQEKEQMTQLVDLYPSLADILDLDMIAETPIHGRSIYGDEDGQREVRFGIDPDERYGGNFIDVRIEKPEDLHHSPLTVIGPAVEPVHWRQEIRRAAE